MVKEKAIVGLIIIMIISVSVLGCTNPQSKKGLEEVNTSISSVSESNKIEEVPNTNNSTESKEIHETSTNVSSSSKPSTIEENQQIKDSLDKGDNAVIKIKGRRKEFLERLDNIQKELDVLPEKKDSDAGVTNAMKNYYGRSYEMYDKELNEIYALLQEELSPETMKDLKTKQIKWIEEKEEKANKAAEKYKGGTFENVSRYISLYKSTKEKCYELVNEYMTD